MAGLPLKSGADFYNLEAARLRLHNLGADPTEVGAGLIYFNTSTGLNTSQKVRLYTGSAWKTIAFSEDLDVASKADLLALKDKVDTLIGDGVDMDGIIESWKEVEAFLSGMSDTKSLMDLLNDKLSLSEGGTIKKPITINSEYAFAITNNATGDWSGIRFRIGGTNKGFLGIGSTGNPIYVPADQSKMYDILTSAGGTIEGNYDALTIKRNSSYASLIVYANADGVMGCLGFTNENTPAWYSSDLTTSYTLLHSGNVGEYALKIDGSNKMGASAYINWATPEGQEDYSAYKDGIRLLGYNPTTGNYMGGIHIGARYGWQLIRDGYTNTMKIRYRNVDTTNWSDWKTIAFTDSNVASAQALQTSGGKTCLVAKEDGSVNTGLNSDGIGYGLYNSLNYGMFGEATGGSPAVVLSGWGGLKFRTGGADKMLINSSGNVTIGDSDLAETSNKLWVDGNARVAGDFSLNPAQNVFLSFSISTSRGAIQAMHDGVAYLPIALNPNGGNVLIGTKEDKGYKLYVDGSVAMKNQGDGAELLRFGIERPWHFIQKGTGSGTSLMLSTTQDNKPFEIGDVNNKAIIQFYASSTVPVVYVEAQVIPLTNNAHRLGSSTARWSTVYGVNGNFSGNMTIDGDLHVKGNIIADGEVSAGGAAEEGGNAGGGGAAEKITATIEVGLKFKEISHTLGDNVIVQVYEWNANGQTWDMVLTDVETTTNLVTVRFGNETDVPHKVVII